MSAKVKIGINGFGRIGRKIARLALQNDNIEVVGINDLGDVETLAHLFKYDTVHGTLKEDVKVNGAFIHVGNKRIQCFAEKDPSRIPWGTVGAQMVHESTGRFTKKEDAGLHLKSGAKRVIISAPSKDADGTFCMGVNHETYDPSKHTVVSNASCTTNCLAPAVKILDDAFGMIRGTMTTIHSYTNDQRILDLPHDDLRRARAAALSQIPTTTGAAKAVGLVLPHLKGKLDGISIRVPTPNVSMVDFTCQVKKTATKDSVNTAFKAAALGPMRGILAYETAELVSSDFNGNLHSSIVDASITAVMDGDWIKVVCWYDNESGFSQRMLDLSLHMTARGL